MNNWKSLASVQIKTKDSKLYSLHYITDFLVCWFVNSDWMSQVQSYWKELLKIPNFDQFTGRGTAQPYPDPPSKK